MGDKIIIKSKKDLELIYYKDEGHFEVIAGDKVWRQKKEFEPYFELILDCTPIKFKLNEAKIKEVEHYKSGVGEGIKVTYAHWSYNGDSIPLSFETLIWIDDTYNELHMEFIPINEGNMKISTVAWPAPFEFETLCEEAYTVLPMMQGCLIPNNWPQKVEAVTPCRLYERAAYMPWWGQIDKGSGYVVIVETPWDAGYTLEHPAGGPTRLSAVWHSSLGQISYKRKMKLSFFSECDYNDFCKAYRNYIKQKGQLVTLEEKAIRNSNVHRLIGSPVIHTGIYSHIKPESSLYDHAHPENNDKLVMFHERTEQLKVLKEKGVKKAYVHLDGWGKMGYDNMHPDVLPPCEKAGGWKGFKEISDTCEQLGYLFAIHDQYRDYYLDAESFNLNQAIHTVEQDVEYESTWFGGKQTYLCTQLSPYYVKRNFETLKDNNIQLKGAYLDVFSVVELDECFHSEHKMTRKECLEKRTECLEYVRSEGILSSSEETVDWAVPHMELCHHAPYALYPDLGEGDARGIPVPLFSLVYHDCIVIPWTLTKGGWGIPKNDSGLLHALLNGGTGYLNIEANQEEIKRNQIVCEFHENIAKQEMKKHEFIDRNFRKQRTTFADGTVVEVDFDTEEYKIGK